MNLKRLDRWATITIALLMFSSVIYARPKEKTFDASREKVFAALTKVIAKHHVITFADEKSFTVSFHTGLSAASYGMNCTASVEADGAKSKVSINTQKTNSQVFAWGAGDRTADNIFKWIAEELAALEPNGSDSKS